MYPGDAAARSASGAATHSGGSTFAGPASSRGTAGPAGSSPLGAGPRLSSGLSFREVGDWFRNLGDDLGSMVGIPRARTHRRSPTPSRCGLESDGRSGSVSSLLGGVPRLPSTSILAKQPQIVVGMLMKYVNLGAGWRHRLFVLQDGVLRYYKVHGPTAVNVHQLLEALRQQGELYSIGVEISLLESRDQRMGAALSGPSSAGLSSPRSPRSRPRLPAPAAEIHLQVASLRESQADYRKFYVHSGTSTLTLRAESKEDRWVWMQALQSSKGSWEGVTPAEASALKRDTSVRIVTQDEVFISFLQEVKDKLAAKGVNADAQTYVEDLLVQEHQRYHEVLVAEENKRKALLDIVYSLENEKRQLETAIVVEGTQAAAFNRSMSSAASDSEEQLQLQDDERQESGVVGGEDGDDGMSSEADEEFYECESQSIGSSHSRGQSVDLTGFVALEKLSGGPGASAAAGAGGGGTGLPMRRSGSRNAMPAPDSAASSPARTPMATSGGATPSALAAAVAAAVAAEPDWLAKERPLPRRRDRLPKPQQAEKSVSLWSLIKDMVGKDLTRVCLPVYFNEPLSALQKTAEDLEYSELLDQAAEMPPGSVDRLLRVAAFAISPYSSTPGRTAKPFNPLLGETFEFVSPEKGFRFLAEKVVHHPTVIAACAEGRRWRYEGDADVKSKFWGRSIELRPEGLLRLAFADGDTYQWNKVTTSINNLILGKIYIDHGGIMKVKCMSTGLMTRIRFKETGLLFDKDPRQVRGFLEQGATRFERPLLHGHWDSELFADMPDGSQLLLWRKNPPPPDPTRYNLTAFSIQLNELTPGLEQKLAPTDCRLRPDQHCLELGLYDQANAEKQRLEHKQRAARKAAERGDPIRPRWFDFADPQQTSFVGEKHGGGGQLHKPGEEPVFKYKGGYWESRETGNWEGCRDIFGPGVPGGEPLALA
ncbi:oxysterol-binding -related 1D isoform X1 [Micractinium conductrix]|uniref:Oxysterol-binding -related 1D isoform X1 n=1 Tax=Micractinium conductrix TaxID=554055 RepID=A0A2P6V3V8_9CHLO|nr:oxysterol-binding -related 1D isoform X1 [Micractinium conductrix]|eukprot:PSC68755.1 oxysterol-binding -related 1D isoform X1 [Micractinium conductrix]